LFTSAAMTAGVENVFGTERLYRQDNMLDLIRGTTDQGYNHGTDNNIACKM
jgi:hypothetical protein